MYSDSCCGKRNDEEILALEVTSEYIMANAKEIGNHVLDNSSELHLAKI